MIILFRGQIRLSITFSYVWDKPVKMDFLVAQTVKNPPAMWETGLHFWVGKIPWRRAWQPTPVFLPRESPWTEEAPVHGVTKRRTGLSD